MRKIKPVWISVLTIVIFAGVFTIGMATDWWQTEGRKTPLTTDKGHEETQSGEAGVLEEEHEKTAVTGSSTVQDALELGITIEQMETILEGDIDDYNATVKEAAQSRGLKFGEVKETLNALIK